MVILGNMFSVRCAVACAFLGDKRDSCAYSPQFFHNLYRFFKGCVAVRCAVKDKYRHVLEWSQVFVLQKVGMSLLAHALVGQIRNAAEYGKRLVGTRRLVVSTIDAIAAHRKTG